MKVNFDAICKELILDLGEFLGFTSRSSFPIDSQAIIESVTGFKSEEKSLAWTIDVVWLNPLPRGLPKGHLVNDVISDVLVAWEVDSAGSRKHIRSSIDSLSTLNPRLGIEFLLIGSYENAIKGFNKRFETAIHAARKKPNRIIVIHDVIFSQIYHSITGKHPEALYNVYLQIAQNTSLSDLLISKWKEVIRKTKIDNDFRIGLEQKLVDRFKHG